MFDEVQTDLVYRAFALPQLVQLYARYDSVANDRKAAHNVDNNEGLDGEVCLPTLLEVLFETKFLQSLSIQYCEWP